MLILFCNKNLAIAENHAFLVCYVQEEKDMRLIEYIYYSGSSMQKFASEIGYDRNYIAQVAKGDIKPTKPLSESILKHCKGHVSERDLNYAYTWAQKLKSENDL